MNIYEQANGNNFEPKPIQIVQDAIINPFAINDFSEDEAMRIVSGAKQWQFPYAGYRWIADKYAGVPILGYFHGSEEPANALNIMKRHGDYLFTYMANHEAESLAVLSGNDENLTMDNLLRFNALNTANMKFYRSKRAESSSARRFREEMDTMICHKGAVRFIKGRESLKEEVKYPGETLFTDPRYNPSILREMLANEMDPELMLQVELMELGGNPLIRALVQDTIRTDPTAARMFNSELRHYHNLLVPRYD